LFLFENMKELSHFHTRPCVECALYFVARLSSTAACWHVVKSRAGGGAGRKIQKRLNTMFIEGKYEPSITVTLWGYRDDCIALRFVNKMLESIDKSDDDSLMQIKVERSEGEGPAGVFFACDGPARTVRPMLAAIMEEGSVHTS
jgi:hypothetical protein